MREYRRTEAIIMKRKQKHDNTHLSLDDRKIIQIGIENNSTKADIARTIGKDATTIAKEIRKHRIFKPRNTYNRPILCGKQDHCNHKPCKKKCELFEEPKCNRRDKSPGACNKCEKMSKCHLNKFFYDAVKADLAYRTELSSCREGLNLTPEERETVGKTLGVLLNQGQSVHQVLSSHPEISQSERTLYYYIESGIFKDFGVDNFSLKEQVNRKQFKQKYKKRKDPANYTGRTYADFLHFRAQHPDTPIVEMDTVYNNPSGPYLQTFLFEKTAFMIGFLHNAKTSENMASSIDFLQQKLGNEMFVKLMPVLLTDRGSEFEKYQLFEVDSDGVIRLNIFYCDPMQSTQKPRIENNHNYIRDIIPNGYPLDNLTQADIDLMFSHINSTPRRSLADKTPFEMLSFLYGGKVAECLNICEIKRDDVVLKPKLIYAKNIKA